MLRHITCISVLVCVYSLSASGAPAKAGAPKGESIEAVEAKAAPSPTGSKSVSLEKKARKKQPKKVRAKHSKGKSKKRVRRFRKSKFPTKRPKNIDLKIPSIGKFPFEPGERLHFNIMMFGQHAGESILAVGKEEVKNGRRTLPLGGFLRGSPFLNKFYPIENSLHVWLEPTSLRPLFSDFVVNENFKNMKYITKYDQKRRRVSSLRYKGKKKLRRSHQPVADVYEPLGCIYAIRSMQLKVGDSFNYYLFDGRKERIVTVKVVGEEDVSVPAGLYRAKKITISTRITGGFVNKKMFDLPNRNGTIWIANDEWSTPLKMIAETKLGPAEAVLTKRYREDGAIVFAEDS
ncbi:MAG: DUF3108 domain-containing protein [Bradymonadia bacterium]